LCGSAYPIQAFDSRQNKSLDFHFTTALYTWNSIVLFDFLDNHPLDEAKDSRLAVIYASPSYEIVFVSTKSQAQISLAWFFKKVVPLIYEPAQVPVVSKNYGLVSGENPNRYAFRPAGIRRTASNVYGHVDSQNRF
jgi:hypothetical protein